MCHRSSKPSWRSSRSRVGQVENLFHNVARPSRLRSRIDRGRDARATLQAIMDSANCAALDLPPLSLVQALQRFFRRAGLDQLPPVIRRTLVGMVGTTIVLVGLLLI